MAGGDTQTPLLRGGGRLGVSRRNMIIVGLAGLCLVVAVSMVVFKERMGLVRHPMELFGTMETGDMLIKHGPAPMFSKSNLQMLASTYDVGSLYDHPTETDFDHPNRIDEYGCMFSNCADDTGAGGLLGKGEKPSLPSVVEVDSMRHDSQCKLRAQGKNAE